MASKQADLASLELWRAELEEVLRSERFSRAPTLAHLLSYLCQKTFAGERDQIKEFSVAMDVFGRGSDFDQDADSIVRVQANRLRKRLAEYYAGEGASHRIHISIPVGQYVPSFEEHSAPQLGMAAPDDKPAVTPAATVPALPVSQPRLSRLIGPKGIWLVAGGGLLLLVASALLIWSYSSSRRTPDRMSAAVTPIAASPAVSASEQGGVAQAADEFRILAGSTRSYVDRAGKLWSADTYFTGGSAAHGGNQYIGRTLDPEIYRSSRQGEFRYDIPLKPGTYELHLHFAETFYGPDSQEGGGEGSRVMAIQANGHPLLTSFDVVADAGGSRTADVKVFTGISPAADGQLHLSFLSVHGGRGMVSGIEILPGQSARMRPLRIVTRESAYYSNDSRWWGPDNYFYGGQLAVHRTSIGDADDPELFESERWGHFSYAIPVAPGKYEVSLLFSERRFGPANRDQYYGPPRDNAAAAGARVFNVFCNGKAVIRELDIYKEAGENRPLIRKITGLEPNAQGKLLFEFVPVKDYATVTAIEVLPE